MNPKSSDRRKRLEELKKDIKDKRKVIESAELGLIRLKQEHNAMADEYKRLARGL